MIVRIMGEGQFRIPGAVLDEMNDVDNAIVEAIAKGEEQQFATLMEQLHTLVLTKGKPLPIEEIVESDLILPPSDSSIDEVRELFSGDGMIPG